MKDKGHKFGGDAEILFHRRSNFRLNYRYFNDVIESAGISFPFYQPNLFVSESFRKFLIRKMDKIEKGELALSFHALQYFDLRFSANQHIRKATDAYTFANEISSSVTYNQKEFFFSEAVFGFRFAYKEKFALTPGKQRISLGTKYPILWGQVTKGFKGDNLGGEFDYFRYDLKIQETFLTKNIGKTVIQFNAGLIDGNLPYIALYNGRGSFVQFNLSAANSFETMRLNEFLSDRYIALFLSHDFEKLLFRTKRFQPKIMLTSNIGFGSLDNAAQHENIDFNTMEKGYYESGLIINNLLKLSFTGIGVGGFYRYGPYANKDFEDNAALKFTVTFEL